MTTDVETRRMTSMGYGSTDLPAPAARSGVMTAVKATVAVVLVCAGLCGALIAGAVAYIVYTGCFLGCSDADPLGGVLLGLLAVGLLVGLPALAAVMWRTARTWPAVKTWAGIVLGGPALLFGLGLAQSAVA